MTLFLTILKSACRNKWFYLGLAMTLLLSISTDFAFLWEDKRIWPLSILFLLASAYFFLRAAFELRAPYFADVIFRDFFWSKVWLSIAVFLVSAGIYIALLIPLVMIAVLFPSLLALESLIDTSSSCLPAIFAVFDLSAGANFIARGTHKKAVIDSLRVIRGTPIEIGTLIAAIAIPTLFMTFLGGRILSETSFSVINHLFALSSALLTFVGSIFLALLIKERLPHLLRIREQTL